MTKTPLNQSESEADRTITQKIRQAIVSDNSMSTDAKNIKIITIKGVVTLRGPVASSQEKDAIAKKVNDVQGVVRVDNQLEVTRKSY
jgi:osmotically-inducible protein OsmY